MVDSNSSTSPADSTQALMDLLEKGLGLARQGEYFLAHEEWEDAWRKMADPDKLFWQAMIQLVVGAYHGSRGNWRGCGNLWKKALVRCQRLASNPQVIFTEPVQALQTLLEEQLLPAAQAQQLPLEALQAFLQQVEPERWYSLTRRP